MSDEKMFVRTVDCSPPGTGELGGGQSVLRPYSEHLPFLTHPPPPIECPPSAGTRSRRPKGHVAPPHTPACTSSPKNLHPTPWKPFQRTFPIAVQSVPCHMAHAPRHEPDGHGLPVNAPAGMRDKADNSTEHVTPDASSDHPLA